MPKNSGSEVEDEFYFQIKAVGLPLPERQAKIIPERRYRWDFCWPERNLLAEIQGGIWVSQTGHTSGSGIARDYEKHNLAVLAGWKTLFFTTQAVRDGSALTILEKALK
jgi:very-short-patch-repair endonuclease